MTDFPNKTQKIYIPSGPTTEKFRRSDAFVRAIKGPIGSGKSTVCVVEILRRSMEQKPAPDGIRKTRWAVIRNCYDDQTEILTERGWVFFKDLREGEKVGQIKDGALEFVKPLSYYKAVHDGEMIGFEGEGIDFLVTPNHKMWVSKKYGRKVVFGEYHMKMAKDIYKHTSYRMKRDVKWIGIEPAFSVDMFEWLGFFFAEGRIGINEVGNRRMVLTQMKPQGIKYAHTLFGKAGIQYTHHGYTFRVALGKEAALGNKLYELLKGIGLSTTLAVPQWIKNAPPEYLRAFIKGFIEGDGNRGAVTTAYTSSKQLADDLQEMTVKAGWVANISFRDRTKTSAHRKIKPTAKEWILTFLTESKYNPRLIKQVGRYRGWYKQEYYGYVYCLEVPTHVVYVRRNGKTLCCTQSYPELKSTTMKTWAQWCPLEYGKLNQDSPITHFVRNQHMDMEVLFLALDRDEDVRKLLSLELTGAWVNEAREIPRAIVDALTGRVGRFPASNDGGCSWYGIMMDTNPPDDQHWWYKLAKDGTPEEWEFFDQPSGRSKDAENLNNLPKGYYQKLSGGKDADWLKVYVDGEYGLVTEGKAVFPMFRDRIHSSPTVITPVPSIALTIGADFGLTPAAAIGQKLGDGRWLIVDEFVTDNCGIVRFAELLAAYVQNNYPDFMVAQGWGDPAGMARMGETERTAIEIMKEYTGWSWKPAPTNDPVMREEVVMAALNRLVDGNPGILISSKCKYIRKALAGGYHYKPIKTGNNQQFHSTPAKNEYSHPAEALEYLLLGGGEMQVVMNRAKRQKKTGPRIATGMDYPIFGGGD